MDNVTDSWALFFCSLFDGMTVFFIVDFSRKSRYPLSDISITNIYIFVECCFKQNISHVIRNALTWIYININAIVCITPSHLIWVFLPFQSKKNNFLLIFFCYSFLRFFFKLIKYEMFLYIYDHM